MTEGFSRHSLIAPSMQILRNVLERAHLTTPDNRPLHAYELTDDELAKLESLLRVRVASGQLLASTAQAFVIWAAEVIRREHAGGPLAWRLVFDKLGLAEDQALARELTREGLKQWARNLRVSEAGTQLFLYSLMAEGGLPDALLAEAGRYRAMLIGLVREIEAEGALGSAMAEAAARRRTAELPQAFQHEDTVRLLADLALGLVEARAALPAELPPEAAVGWLDAHRPDWRRALPIRLSQGALEALVRPALAAERGQRGAQAAPVRRLLRQRSDGRAWVGLAEIIEDAFLSEALVGREHSSKRLRLLAETGETFLAVPERGGHRLRRSGGRGRVLLLLSPDSAVVLSAHSDGRSIGDVVLDPGLPAPDEAPSLWRSSDHNLHAAEELIPLPGRGRTRARHVWLLVPQDVTPTLGPGISCDETASGPGGVLWPLSGEGTVEIGEYQLRLATEQDSDDPPARLAVFGPLLAGWSLAGGGQAYVGSPQIFGSEGEGPLRRVEKRLRRRSLRQLLGGEIVEWSEDGLTLARLRLVVLPQELVLRLRERDAGTLALSAEGLRPGWHVALLAGGRDARGIADTEGALQLSLSVGGTLPSDVRLVLSSPKDSARLELVAPWPSRSALIIEPDGKRLERNRSLAVGRLAGWRGWLPEGGGAVQLRLSSSGRTVAFPEAGAVRVAAYEAVVRQLLALAGPDAKVNLSLVAGQETSRLELGRYDWELKDADPFDYTDMGRTWFFAVDVHRPTYTLELEAEGGIDVVGWLGEHDALWFLQGVSEVRGVMRPIVWSPRPVPASTRDDRIRIRRFAKDWRWLLGAPYDPDWDRFWSLIGAARQGGNAGALDQVVALGEVPEAAVALLFRLPRTEAASVLALETEAPLWWPLVPCAAWVKGVSHALDYLISRLSVAGFAEGEARQAAEEALSWHAGAIVTLRPELSVHLGQALAAVGLPPLARDSAGAPLPLAVPDPPARLEELAQEAARRFDALPQGVAHIAAVRLHIAPQLTEAIRPLIDTPCLAAEIAAGLLPHPDTETVLTLIALRAADPVWFDEALPAALSLALEIDA